MEDQSPSKKLWRTLLRVDFTDDRCVYFIIPGWSTLNVIGVPKEKLPSEVSKLKIGSRLFAKVNIGAENPEDLIFADWELK